MCVWQTGDVGYRRRERGGEREAGKGHEMAARERKSGGRVGGKERGRVQIGETNGRWWK